MILHQHYNDPAKGGAVRSYYLATALAAAGHQVTVLTAHAQTKETHSAVDGFELIALPITYKNEFTFWPRSFAFLRFAFAAARAGSRFRSYDVCYAISTPLTIGLPAWWLNVRYGIPFYFEVGDLWPDAPIQLGFVKNPILRLLLRGWELRMYRQATAIVALSVAIRTAIEKRVPGKTVHLLPNMADTDYYQPVEKPTAAVQKFGLAGKFVVSYLGALGFANGLDFLLECANACRKQGAPVHFLVAGEGAEENRLRKTALHMGLTNISFLGLLARDHVREVLTVTDSVLISYRMAPVLETGSPNKYFDGLAAGKLTVINFGGWIRTEIERERCGIWINPQQPSEFVTKLAPFWQEPTLLKSYQAQARRLAEREYARTTLAKKFAQLFHQRA